jgi:hypothetical protein
LAEGDLFIERTGFGVVAIFLLPVPVAVSGGGEGKMRGVAQGRCGGVFKDADGETGERGSEGLSVTVRGVRVGVSGGGPG